MEIAMLRKSRRQIIFRFLVILLIIVATSHRISKIIQKEERKQQEANSVVAKTIWKIKLPAEEFIGDLSQVGNYLVYELPEESNPKIFKTYARRLDDGVVTAIETQPSHFLDDPLFIGRSILQKKEFRIESDNGVSIVAQYHVDTRARGIIATLPDHCDNWKTVQRLPQNFFALECVCIDEKTKQPSKRLIVIELETRRLTYASGQLPSDMHFRVFTR